MKSYSSLRVCVKPAKSFLQYIVSAATRSTPRPYCYCPTAAYVADIYGRTGAVQTQILAVPNVTVTACGNADNDELAGITFLNLAVSLSAS